MSDDSFKAPSNKQESERPADAANASNGANHSSINASPNLVELRSVFAMEQTLHVGPLPPVDAFEGYERVYPGAAKEILKMAQQQSHQYELELSQLRGELVNKRLGMFAGVVVVGMVMAAIIVALLQNASVPATILASIGIVSLVAVFVNGGLSRRNPVQTSDGAETPEAGKRR